MAIIKHISVKNRFYSDAVEYLTCKFDEYTNKPILDEKGRVQERDSYLIEGVNCNADTFGAECIDFFSCASCHKQHPPMPAKS